MQWFFFINSPSSLIFCLKEQKAQELQFIMQIENMIKLNK